MTNKHPDPGIQAAIEVVSEIESRLQKIIAIASRGGFRSSLEDVFNHAMMAKDAVQTLRALPQAQPDTAALVDIWNQAEMNHREYSATGSAEEDLRFFALGLVGEAGEVANFVKKRWRDGEDHTEDLRLECADVLAYTTMLAQSLGMTPQDLIAAVAYKQQVFRDKMKALSQAKEKEQA